MAIRKDALGNALYANKTSVTDFKIFRYTKEVQQALHSNVKAEPWLHIAIYVRKSLEPEMNGSKVDYGTTIDAYYVIYVWDTRKVVATGDAELLFDSSYNSKPGISWHDIHAPKANDNGAKLDGSSKVPVHNLINERWPAKQSIEVKLGYV